MKRILATVLTLFSLAWTSVWAARVNVFENELGNLGTSDWKTEVNGRAVALLDNHDIDFGYFNGCKSIDYFKLSHPDYTTQIKAITSKTVPARTYFTYKTAKYDIVQLGEGEDLFDLEFVSGISTYCIAYLLKDKVTNDKYLCVHVAGTAFNDPSTEANKKYYEPIENLINRCLSKHGDARLIVSHPQNNQAYVKYYANLLTYLDGTVFRTEGTQFGAMTNLVSDATAGGIHVAKSPAACLPFSSVLTEKTSSNDAAGYPLVATLAYPHKVVFADDDGTVLKASTVTDGEAAVAPADPVRSGYEFIGWEPSDFSNVTNDMAIVAKYQAVAGSVIVTFEDDDSTVLSTASVKVGEKVAPPAENPTKTGHTFDKWMKDDVPYDFNTPVNEALTLTASYTANVYTVTFQYGDGTEIDTQKVKYLQAAVAPADPTPKDPKQVFFRWDSDFSCIVADTVVTALFLDQTTEVGTAQDFLGYVAVGLPAHATLKLTADLDFTRVAFTASDFAATLDGNGHAVTGLSTAPLFDVLSGTVKDLTIRDCDWKLEVTANFLANELRGATLNGCVLEGCSVSVTKYGCGIGGFAANAYTNAAGVGTMLTNCIVRNCDFAYGKRSGVYVGGFVQHANHRTVFADCVFTTTNDSAIVVGKYAQATGAFVAESVGSSFVRCRNNGRVGIVDYGANYGAGGIAGCCTGARSTFENCTNTVAIVNEHIGGAGGIVGRIVKGTVSFVRCINRGDVSAACVLENNPAGMGAGGICGGAWGQNYACAFADCANYGSVTALTAEGGRMAGGIVGDVDSSSAAATFGLSLTNCVNHGAVTAAKSAGGLVGHYSGLSQDGHAIVNCANTGAVRSPTGCAGGVVGWMADITQNKDTPHKYDQIVNVANAARVETEDGLAGGYVGKLTGSQRSPCTFAPTNLVLSTAVSAGPSGFAASLCASNEVIGAAITIADSDTHYLAPADYNAGQAKRILNDWVKAQSVSYPKWITSKDGLDLDIFGIPRLGLVIMFR